MTHKVTKGIVLTRINFSEADRIIVLLTPDYGKIRVLARGVRKIKSKLAGGIELFSESNITFIKGRGEIGTLVSSRLIKNYSQIVKSLDSTNLAYDFLKSIDKVTEDSGGEDYYELLRSGLDELNNNPSMTPILELWFIMRLLKISGHSPNLESDISSKSLNPDHKYTFDLEQMTFAINDNASFSANHIKLLRLVSQAFKPDRLNQIKNAEKQVTECLQIAKSMLKRFMQV